MLVFTERWKKEATEAGAVYVGGKELVDRIQEGWLDFDEAIATPEMADEIQRISKILQPIGLMPTLKEGTVTDDVQGKVKKILEEEKVTLRRRDILEVVRYRSSGLRTARAKSMTSITWETAGSGPWGNCSRTSITSASSGSSGRSRNA